jgi:uncharacterized protein YunC (DUF1805 family)
MVKFKKIKVGAKFIQALVFKLSSKNIVVLRGSRGYVMCGYLNLKTAQKFGDAAVKIVGVCDIADALNAQVHSRTAWAGRLGIHKGQPIREVLRLIV